MVRRFFIETSDKETALKVLAAGGINESNVSEYAQAAIDGIVTTSLYMAKPTDIGVKIVPVN